MLGQVNVEAILTKHCLCFQTCSYEYLGPSQNVSQARSTISFDAGGRPNPFACPNYAFQLVPF